MMFRRLATDLTSLKSAKTYRRRWTQVISLSRNMTILRTRRVGLRSPIREGIYSNELSTVDCPRPAERDCENSRYIHFGNSAQCEPLARDGRSWYNSIL